MLAAFVQQGTAVDYTPAADIAAGAVVVQGDLVGIAKHNIKANVLGALAVEGVFDIAKDPATVIAAGTLLYWDETNSIAVTLATGNKLLGKAVAAAPATTTVVRTRLSQ